MGSCDARAVDYRGFRIVSRVEQRVSGVGSAVLQPRSPALVHLPPTDPPLAPTSRKSPGVPPLVERDLHGSPGGLLAAGKARHESVHFDRRTHASEAGRPVALRRPSNDRATPTFRPASWLAPLPGTGRLHCSGFVSSPMGSVTPFECTRSILACAGSVRRGRRGPAHG